MQSKKPLRSFGRIKSRKLRDNSQRLLNDLLPKVQFSAAPAGKDLWLEIGFGTADHLVGQAINNPNVHIIGAEPFINGVAIALRGIEENNLTNVSIHNGDARELLEKLPDNSLARVYILFPDPWPKLRHHKRRIIQQNLLDELQRVMKHGAELRVATDHEGYGMWILREVLAHKGFAWPAKSKVDWQNEFTGHIKTKYQMKNMAKTARPLFFRFIKLGA